MEFSKPKISLAVIGDTMRPDFHSCDHWFSESLQVACEGLLNPRPWSPPLEFSNSGCLRWAWAFAFLTSLQVMFWLLVQGLCFEKCQLLKVSRMKYTQIIINHSDGGINCDSDDRIIVPISLTIFFQFLDVGRRKSWWSTTGMEPWRKESPADSMEKLASLRRWCIWWTRGRQRLQTSSWRQTRHGTCRMWIWRLGCNAYFMTLEINHHWRHNHYRELGHHRCNVLLIVSLGIFFLA